MWKKLWDIAAHSLAGSAQLTLQTHGRLRNSRKSSTNPAFSFRNIDHDQVPH
jgi:hypothetical protein